MTPSYNARAVVTGAGSGIGRAFALELAKRGGEVICADISRSRAEATAALIGAKAHAVVCDVSQREQVEDLALFAELTFGRAPTLVVNNAGVGIGGRPVGDIGFEDWNWALGINLWGVVHGCETFAPGMKAAGDGGFINVASAAGFAAAPLMGPYNVSKAGVMSLSETMAAEGVRVTVLCPTFVKTNVAVDGRITETGTKLASSLMRATGFTPEKVAADTLNKYDRGRLYVVPQFDAKVIWRLKRIAPALYTRALGLLGRLAPQESENRVVPADSTHGEKTGI